MKTSEIHTWEDEGGAPSASPAASTEASARPAPGSMSGQSIPLDRPMYDRIVVKPIGGQSDQGEVVAIVRGRGLKTPALAASSAKVGERILFARRAGNPTEFDFGGYMIVREDEVLEVVGPDVAKRRALNAH